MIQHGRAPFIECSSQGDRRFSAFHARVSGYDGRSIEDVYQAAKKFEDGSTGLPWREAKGRTPVNPNEVRRLYASLWDSYVDENPALGSVITSASGLSDKFGQPGHACQATELWRIRGRLLGHLRILVCGGRDYDDRGRLFTALTAVHRSVGIAEIIHGAARGADHLAGLWARTNGVTETRFPVDHRLDGPWPKAGPMRNMRMYRESLPDMVLAFPGGRGTSHMVNEARERGCPFYEVNG